MILIPFILSGFFIITHYCADKVCTGKDASHPQHGITASGALVRPGIIACPPEMPFGTKLKIGKKTYVCLDRGGSIKGNKLDIYVETHEEALRRGKRLDWVEVVR